MRKSLNSVSGILLFSVLTLSGCNGGQSLANPPIGKTEGAVAVQEGPAAPTQKEPTTTPRPNRSYQTAQI